MTEEMLERERACSRSADAMIRAMATILDPDWRPDQDPVILARRVADELAALRRSDREEEREAVLGFAFAAIAQHNYLGIEYAAPGIAVVPAQWRTAAERKAAPLLAALGLDAPGATS